MTSLPIYTQSTENEKEAPSRIRRQLDSFVLLVLFFKHDILSITAFRIHSLFILPSPFVCLFTNEYMEKTGLVS